MLLGSVQGVKVVLLDSRWNQEMTVYKVNAVKSQYGIQDISCIVTFLRDDL